MVVIPPEMIAEAQAREAERAHHRRTDRRVLGLDLSITATGVALTDGKGVDTWKMPAAWGDRRLFEIAHKVGIEHSVDHVELAVIEDLPTHARSAGITGQVHGAVKAKLIGLHVPYALVTPATLKKFATGKGNAGKPDMAVALYKRTGTELADDNQTDAVWLRLAGLAAYGILPFDLPAGQLAALDKVTWPETVRFDGAKAA